MKQSRINWVDTLKFLGIFAIYLGHYGEVAKKAYPFVFEYHVPLFLVLCQVVLVRPKTNDK